MSLSKEWMSLLEGHEASMDSPRWVRLTLGHMPVPSHLHFCGSLTWLWRGRLTEFQGEITNTYRRLAFGLRDHKKHFGSSFLVLCTLACGNTSENECDSHHWAQETGTQREWDLPKRHRVRCRVAQVQTHSWLKQLPLLKSLICVKDPLTLHHIIKLEWTMDKHLL